MIIEYPDKRYTVEPANVHCISYIKSINIANVERTLADPPKDCTKEDIPDTYVTNTTPPSGDYFMYNGKKVYPYARGLTGNVILVPGFNCGITKIQNNNELQVSAMQGIGANLYEPQEEKPLYTGETRPSKSTLYSGGIPCYETVKSINGVELKTVNIEVGKGITLESVNDNTLKINIDDTRLKGECTKPCGNTN